MFSAMYFPVYKITMLCFQILHLDAWNLKAFWTMGSNDDLLKAKKSLTNYLFPPYYYATILPLVVAQYVSIVVEYHILASTLIFSNLLHI